MNLILKRNEYGEAGIFGDLLDTDGNVIAVTLEHAYDSGLGNGSYAPKIPAGTYTCKRSMHRLHGMTNDFETFQVRDVPKHTNILLHWGNYNEDSDGCILVGRRVVLASSRPAGKKMITSSRNAFNKVMDLQKGLNEFTLTVKDHNA